MKARFTYSEPGKPSQRGLAVTTPETLAKLRKGQPVPLTAVRPEGASYKHDGTSPVDSAVPHVPHLAVVVHTPAHKSKPKGETKPPAETETLTS